MMDESSEMIRSAAALRDVPVWFTDMPGFALVEMAGAVVPAQSSAPLSGGLRAGIGAKQVFKNGTGAASSVCEKGGSAAPDPVCFP